MNRKALANTLIGIQSQLNAALDILFDGEDPMCDHPEERRKVFTTMGSPEHWVCKDCGYEYKEGVN